MSCPELDGGERARPLYINFFEVVIISGVTVVRGADHLHLFFRGRDNFGRDGGGIIFEKYFTHFIGTDVRGPDHFTFILSRS